jgi:hypothetical protein
MWNKEVAVVYAQKHALPYSIERCELFVRRAINAGGIYSLRAGKAEDLGDSLLKSGFYEISDQPKRGDIAVIQGYPGNAKHKANIYGHTCIYDGKHWISDFVQHGMYPGQIYRELQPAYKIYRHD